MDISEPRHRIIFPLDVRSKEEALSYVKLLKDHVGVFKVGLELFVNSGPRIVETVKAAAPAAGVFLDLKFHDIPATVGRACRSAARLGVDFVTVHADTPDLAGAVAEVGGGTKVLGVTVLTSLSAEDFIDMGIDPRFKNINELVLYRAWVARRAGCSGVVCSGLEVKKVKEEYGEDFIAVTPGIRLDTGKKDDQKRVVTPGFAVRNGADFIVVGRPIRDARDPVAAAALVASGIEEGLKARP
jgi:orotidine-5'-phosphate decarboxylase